MKSRLNIVLLFFVLYSGGSQAEEYSVLKGYSITIGLSSKQLSFDYYLNENDALPTGSMTEGSYISYFIRSSSPYVYSKSKRFGYYYEFGGSSFAMTKQLVNNEEKNLGTLVKGDFWYVTPIGFVMFGPPPGKNQLTVILGLGLGLGYLNAQGQMRLTEDNSNRLLQVDLQGLSLASSTLMEAHYGKWMVRIVGGGPYLDVAQTTYSAFDFSIDMGYSYTF